MDRHPFAAYHTCHDDMSLVKLDRLEEMVNVLTSVADTMEQDYVPRLRNRVPVYLTRYNLYADWTYQREKYDLNALMLDSMWSGLSVFDIALKHSVDVQAVYSYLEKFAELNLMEKLPITPDYTRNIRFLPDLPGLSARG
jgi:aminopeptidase-like protein